MSWEILEITLRSIYISGTATLLSTLWGLPLGVIIGVKDFAGKRIIKGIFNALLGLPTVALGLILYLTFRHAGPLGFLGLLFNPLVVVIGQAILITPVIISLTASAVESVDPEIKDLAKTLGASETQASMAVLRESVGGTFLAVIASFNRAIAELGVVYMVGGDIRVLTTTIALQRDMGQIEFGLSLAGILLSIVFAISLTINLIQRQRK